MNDISEAYNQLRVPQAKILQDDLRRQIDLAPISGNIEVVAGADISLNRFSQTIYAGIVLLRYSDMQPFACALVESTTTFPYIPGYLAFREVPALLKALRLLPQQPDAIMVDGHGIAHPRRMGIATHFGLLAGIPTLGCAKKLLFGKYDEPGPEQYDTSPLLHKDELMGHVLRTKRKVKPVFISPGNKMSVADSLAIARQCARRHRLPEPTRQAHEAVNLFRKGILKEGYQSL